MAIQKPLPLMVGDKAYYTLTSYDPVEITVDVPLTTEADVEFALDMTLADMGATQADLDDPAWVAKHFEGLATREQILEVMRREVTAMNQRAAEAQKMGRCIDALAARLVQAILPQYLERARQEARAAFAQQLGDEGLTPEQVLANLGASQAQVDAIFDRRAQQMAEGDAALLAYAHEKRLKVDEQELGELLGIPKDKLPGLVAEVKAAGYFDDMREDALRRKAASMVVAECKCTYRIETAEEAAERAAQYQAARDEYDARLGSDAPSQGTSSASGFKLV